MYSVIFSQLNWDAQCKTCIYLHGPQVQNVSEPVVTLCAAVDIT